MSLALNNLHPMPTKSKQADPGATATRLRDLCIDPSRPLEVRAKIVRQIVHRSVKDEIVPLTESNRVTIRCSAGELGSS